MSAYHTVVSRWLNDLKRLGALIETSASGIVIIGLPSASGAYETVYSIQEKRFDLSGASNGYLIRTERDEYGRILKRERLSTITDNGPEKLVGRFDLTWEPVPGKF